MLVSPGTSRTSSEVPALGGEVRAASCVHGALVRLALGAYVVEAAQISIVVLDEYICFFMAGMNQFVLALGTGPRCSLH